MSYALTGEFTVKDARNRGNIPNPHGGELTRWYVDFLDSSGEPVKDGSGKVADCYWQRKPDNDVTVGDTVYGVITEGDYGLRFKAQQRPDGAPRGGGSERSSGGGSKGKWEPESSRDPERSARILRQHSQGLAVKLAIFTKAPLVESEATGPNTTTKRLHPDLVALIDAFDADVNQAGKAASQGVVGSPGPEVATPNPSPGPPDSPPADLSHQEIGEALDTAGLVYAPARDVVISYMVSQLSEADRTRAVKQLVDAQDTAAQGQTLRAMQQRTEAWKGEPLPQGDALDGADDVPF